MTRFERGRHGGRCRWSRPGGGRHGTGVGARFNRGRLEARSGGRVGDGVSPGGILASITVKGGSVGVYVY